MKTKPLGPRGLRTRLASNPLAGRLPSTLLAASLLTGCAPTTTQVRRVESPTRVRLVRPEPEASLGGEFRYEAGAVVGRLAWQNACRREEVRRVEKQKVNVTPLITKEASALYIAIGAAVVLGGAVAIAYAGDSSSADYHSCSDTSDDECKSPRQLYTEAGVGLIATGLGIGGLGVVGLATKPRVEPVGAPTVEQKVRTIESDVACGKPRSLAGIARAITGTSIPSSQPAFSGAHRNRRSPPDARSPRNSNLPASRGGRAHRISRSARDGASVPRTSDFPS